MKRTRSDNPPPLPIRIIAPLGFCEAIIIHCPIGAKRMAHVYALGPERMANNDILANRWKVRAVICGDDWAKSYLDNPKAGMPPGFTVYI